MDQGGKETSFSLLELRKTTGPRIAVFPFPLNARTFIYSLNFYD